MMISAVSFWRFSASATTICPLIFNSFNKSHSRYLITFVICTTPGKSQSKLTDLSADYVQRTFDLIHFQSWTNGLSTERDSRFSRFFGHKRVHPRRKAPLMISPDRTKQPQKEHCKQFKTKHMIYVFTLWKYTKRTAKNGQKNLIWTFIYLMIKLKKTKIC